MSAELAILNRAKRNNGDTRVIFQGDFDGATMLDVSDKFFAPTLIPNVGTIANTTFDGITADMGTSIYQRVAKFSPDGLNLYHSINTTSGVVVLTQYTLSIPFDITTKVAYATLSIPNNSVSSLLFDDVGSQLYVFETGTGKSVRYTLATPYDISTATLFTDVENSGVHYYGATFYNNGLNMLMTRDNVFYVWTLTTAYSFDVNATFVQVSNTDIGINRGSTYNTSGTRILMVDDASTVKTFTLTTPYDVTTAVYDGIPYTLSNSASWGIDFNGDRTKFIVSTTDSGETADVYEYTINGSFEDNLIVPPPVENPSDLYKIVVMK